jgi:hypothetical protein
MVTRHVDPVPFPDLACADQKSAKRQIIESLSSAALPPCPGPGGQPGDEACWPSTVRGMPGVNHGCGAQWGQRCPLFLFPAIVAAGAPHAADLTSPNGRGPVLWSGNLDLHHAQGTAARFVQDRIEDGRGSVLVAATAGCACRRRWDLRAPTPNSAQPTVAE